MQIARTGLSCTHTASQGAFVVISKISSADISYIKNGKEEHRHANHKV